MPNFRFYAKPLVEADRTAEHVVHAQSLGLPYALEGTSKRLAVVGGGPSARHYAAELLGFTGDVWIIGSAFRYWNERGLKGTYFSVHPSELAMPNIEGIKNAIVASCTHPAVFAQLAANGASVRIFDLCGVNGCSSVTAIPYQALKMGYELVHFFGCESSYEEKSHAYANVADKWDIAVRCNGQFFKTCAEFLMQAEYLSAMIRAARHIFKERSGGLLRAMCDTPDVLEETRTGDYTLTHISRYIANDIGQLEAA